ncbi:conserved hypothetical protein (plasmid) [Gloeothece citriformis PCC 7424]|uniref:Uncharacterized protein n=1 Tax=Gloeothece citriformis (strain PCC 7424) TaxID=65393 RepID=B7KMG8_GLOC7|nr:hypothetical protein [Gloeothece citriformis]ACK73990.1 conserved hypothetical protein [Gloeothece citriformis PCC 7424]
MLRLKHFHTQLRRDLDLPETLNNTIAEYLFPETAFAIGDIEKNLTPQDLRPYGEFSLQFSNRHRMYFANQEVGELLYPTISDRIAYGSLPFTANQSFYEVQQARILIIDHTTGNNGNILPEEFAIGLVGDCWGKVSPDPFVTT